MKRQLSDSHDYDSIINNVYPGMRKGRCIIVTEPAKYGGVHLVLDNKSTIGQPTMCLQSQPPVEKFWTIT